VNDETPDNQPSVDSVSTTDAPCLKGVDLVGGYLPGVDILRGCSAELYKHEIVGVIGPNGAGKSTLLRALFGQLKIRSGSVELNGVAVTGVATHELVRRGVGFVPQLRNVFGTLTVRENLRMGAFQDARAFDQRLEELVQRFPRLGERINQRAGSLSGGERQVLAMSRALMAKPTVLLLDEPSAGLSPSMQDEVFDAIVEVNRSGVAVLMVEQNARRCLEIANRGYVLDQGKDAYTGTGAQLLDDPKVIELYLGTLGRPRP